MPGFTILFTIFHQSKVCIFKKIFGIGSYQKLFLSQKNICFDVIQNDGKFNIALKQRSVIKFQVSGKCRPCEINCRMCDE